jgi:hypothetical protein
MYKFPGFRARSTLKPHPTDKAGYIITLERRQKKQFALFVGRRRMVSVIVEFIESATLIRVQFASILNSNIAVLPVPTVMP